MFHLHNCISLYFKHALGCMDGMGSMINGMGIGMGWDGKLDRMGSGIGWEEG